MSGANSLNINIGHINENNQLQITVENLGPVKKANIKLSPLTIFFGKNNTGKTYLSYAIWGILNSSELQSQKLFTESFYNHKIASISKEITKFVIDYITNEELSQKATKKIFPLDGGMSKITINYKFIQKIFNHKTSSLTKSKVSITIDPPILENIELLISVQASKHGRLDDGRDLTDIILNTLLRDIVGFTIIPLSREEEKQYSLISENVDMWLVGGIIVSSKSILDKKGKKLNYQLRFYIDQEIFNKLKKRDKKLLETLQKKISKYLYWYLMNVGLSYLIQGKEGIFIPASKSGLGLIRKDLYAKGVEALLSFETKKGRTPKLPYPLIHYLQNLAIISTNKEGNTTFKKLVEFLENDLSQGIIYYDEQREDILYRPKGTKLKIPMYVASSLVVETMPLITFLKYGIIDKNSVVILEEPESHLHPEAQKLLARGLVKLVNRGVYVILVTHSPYIIQQINNNIRLFYLKQINKQKYKEFSKKYGWDNDEALDPQKISAYLFDKDDHNKTIVRTLTITPEEGISYEAFYEPLYRLRQETQELRALLEGVDK
ncbi:AAA family ATPase [Thermococcus aciditolerans]|nr:AAA family ATPase [Thermococcus aciditolerans]